MKKARCALFPLAKAPSPGLQAQAPQALPAVAMETAGSSAGTPPALCSYAHRY